MRIMLFGYSLIFDTLLIAGSGNFLNYIFEINKFKIIKNQCLMDLLDYRIGNRAQSKINYFL